VSEYRAKHHWGSLLPQVGGVITWYASGLLVIWATSYSAYVAGRFEISTAIYIVFGLLIFLYADWLAVSWWRHNVLEIGISEESLRIRTGAQRIEVGWQGVQIERFVGRHGHVRIAISIPSRQRPIVLSKYNFESDMEPIWSALVARVPRDE
jgi:hypothetical protein